MIKISYFFFKIEYKYLKFNTTSVYRIGIPYRYIEITNERFRLA